MDQFSSLTDSELHQLAERLYHGVMRLFDEATAVFSQMGAMSTWTQQYADLNRRTGVLMAAGREQDQLLREVSDLIRYRRDLAAAQAEAARRLAALELDTDGDWAAIRQADAIESADRRDDPLKTER